MITLSCIFSPVFIQKYKMKWEGWASEPFRDAQTPSKIGPPLPLCPVSEVLPILPRVVKVET